MNLASVFGKRLQVLFHTTGNIAAPENRRFNICL